MQSVQMNPLGASEGAGRLAATALAFGEFADPAHRKDPGDGDFECGVITAGVLVGGLVYIVLNLLGLW